MSTVCEATCAQSSKKTSLVKKEDSRVRNSKLKLIEWIGHLPKLEFTSGDVTRFINGRVTYQTAWDQIRDGDSVLRVGPVRGKATTWRRGSLPKTRKVS